MPTHARPEPPPPGRTPGRAHGAGQVVAMAAIGLLVLLFAPVAIPLVLWIRWRDRRAARSGAADRPGARAPWSAGAAGGRPARPPHPRPATGSPERTARPG